MTQTHLAKATGLIDQALSHHNVAAGAPVFQDVRSRIERDVRDRFSVASFASSPEAAALLPSLNIVSSVFTPIQTLSLRDDAALDERLAQQVHDHLQPILERYAMRNQ